MRAVQEEQILRQKNEIKSQKALIAGQKEAATQLSSEYRRLSMEKNQLLLIPLFAPLTEKINLIRSRAAKDFSIKSEPYTVAMKLADDLEKQLEIFNYANPHKELSKLKSKSKSLIDKAKQELSKYKGWDQILNEVLLCVCTLVIPYLIAMVANKVFTGNFTFFNEGRSRSNTKALSQQIKSLEEPSLEADLDPADDYQEDLEPKSVSHDVIPIDQLIF